MKQQLKKYQQARACSQKNFNASLIFIEYKVKAGYQSIIDCQLASTYFLHREFFIFQKMKQTELIFRSTPKVLSYQKIFLG